MKSSGNGLFVCVTFDMTPDLFTRGERVCVRAFSAVEMKLSSFYSAVTPLERPWEERVTQGKNVKTCVFGDLSLAHNAAHLLQETPRNAITDPHIHKSTQNHAQRCNDCQGGQGESKQGQISSDSEGRQLHILISLHFRFLLLNFYLICGTSPPRIPSQPPCVPLCLSPDFCNLSSSQHTSPRCTVKGD